MDQPPSFGAKLLAQLGSSLLPFAKDPGAATTDLPWSRLLRLSMFQLSVGLALATVFGTLSHVMRIELGLSATVVTGLVALLWVTAPLRVLLGFRSDKRRSPLGWRRVPYLWTGNWLQFGGFTTLPLALLVLAGPNLQAPEWLVLLGVALAFALVGFGLHMVQTAGMALVGDATATNQRAQVLGLMLGMQLVGMVGGAALLGFYLSHYSPNRLIGVVQAVAVVGFVLNVVAFWKQEPRSARRNTAPLPAQTWGQAWQTLSQRPGARGAVFVLGLGTMAFTLAFALALSVGHGLGTPGVLLVVAFGGVVGLAWSTHTQAHTMQGHNTRTHPTIGRGLWMGWLAVAALTAAAHWTSSTLLLLGVGLGGVGAGLFAHGTLSAALQHALPHQMGLAMGVWGAVHATAAGLGMATVGFASLGHTAVVAWAAALLLLSLWATRALDPGKGP